MSIATSIARHAALGSLGDHPFVLWDNKAIGATITSNVAVASDGPLASAVTGTTFDYWKPVVVGTTATFQILISSQTIGCVGIASHNLGTLGATVAAQRSTDGGTTWVDGGAGEITPTDDTPIVFRMVASDADATRWRVLISGLTASDPVAVGVIFFGTELVFPTRFYQGFAPVLAATEIDLQSNVSQGNHLLGSSVVSRGSTMEAAFTYVTPDFARTDLPAFQEHFNTGNGFFFAWRPLTYATDVHYCWRDGAVLRPKNDGARDFMSFSMAMRAHNG